METSFYQDGKNHYLRITGKELDNSRYKVKMLIANQPEYLLRLHVVHEGAKCYYDYPVSGLVSLSQCTPQEIMQRYLYNLLYALSHLEEELCGYMLDAKDILLQPESIFLEREKERFFFCYNPDGEGTLQKSVEGLTEYLLKELKPGNEAETLLLYGLYQKSREQNVTLASLEQFSREMKVPEKKDEFPEMESISLEEEQEEQKNVRGEQQELYQEIGLSYGNPDKPFEEWQEKNSARKSQAGSYSQMAYDPPKEKPLKSSPVKNLGRKIKEYAFEICVGCVVSAGVILMIVS